MVALVIAIWPLENTATYTRARTPEGWQTAHRVSGRPTRGSTRKSSSSFVNMALSDPGEHLYSLLETREILSEERTRSATLEARAMAAEMALQERESRLRTLLQERETLQKQYAELASQILTP